MTDCIVKQHRKNNFTHLPNEVIRDERLTFKALGLLAYLLSLPPNWKLNLVHLSNLRPGNKSSSVKSAVAELQMYGYMRIKRIRESGRFVGAEWLVTDSPDFMANRDAAPQVDFPPVDIPQVEKPQVEKATLQRKSNNKTDYLKNIQQPQKSEGNCSVDLIFPTLGVAEVETLKHLINGLEEESAQEILDELEGYRRAGKITTGSIPLAYKLISELKNGAFQVSKGVAVKSARINEAKIIESNKKSDARARPPADLITSDCANVMRLNEIERKKKRYPAHAG